MEDLRLRSTARRLDYDAVQSTQHGGDVQHAEGRTEGVQHLPTDGKQEHLHRYLHNISQMPQIGR